MVAAKLTWLDADGNPQCGHGRAVGRPGPYPGEWYCSLCGAAAIAALDQEIAAAVEAAHARGEVWD